MLQVRSDEEIEKAFATMAERQARGLLFGPSTYFQVIADKLIALAARYRIPAAYEWRRIRRGRRVNELQRAQWRNKAA